MQEDTRSRSSSEEPSSLTTELFPPELSRTPVQKKRSSYRGPINSHGGFYSASYPDDGFVLTKGPDHNFSSDATQDNNDICKWLDPATDKENDEDKNIHVFLGEEVNFVAGVHLLDCEKVMGPKEKIHDEIFHEQVLCESCTDLPLAHEEWDTRLAPGIKSEAKIQKKEVPMNNTIPRQNSFLRNSAEKRDYVQEFIEGARSADFGVEGRLVELIQKMTGFTLNESLNQVPLASLYSAILQPPLNKKVVYLQKKVEELKSQVADEKRQRQLVAQMLAKHRQEAEQQLQRMGDEWQKKYSDLQKEKNLLSIHLQELELKIPRLCIAKGGGKVALTDEEYNNLRQEILEQETLIKGYQLENEKAVEKLKKVEAEAKEKALQMTEENASIASHLANLHECHGAFHGAQVSADNINLKAEVHNANSRVAILSLEVERLIQLNKSLEFKLSKMNAEIIAKNENKEESKCNPLYLGATPAKDAEFESPCKINKTNSAKAIACEEVLDNDHSERFHEKKMVVHKGKVISTQTNQKHDLKVLTTQEYEAKIQSLKQQLGRQTNKMVTPFDCEQVSTRKIKDLEKQVEDVRSFYIKKVKGLQSRLEDAQKENGILDSKTRDFKDKKRDARRLSIFKFSTHDEAQETTQLCALGYQEMAPKVIQKKFNVQRTSFSKHLKPRSRALRMGSNSEGSHDEVDQKKLIEVKDACIVRKEHDGMTIFSEAYLKNEVELLSSRQSGFDAKKLEVLEKSAVDLEARLKDLSEKFAVSQEKQDDSQRLSQLAMLKKRVEDMEAHQAMNELQWQELLEETKRIFCIEQDMLERKWHLALDAKNAEIERLQLEIDAILEAAIQMQQAQFQ